MKNTLFFLLLFFLCLEASQNGFFPAQGTLTDTQNISKQAKDLEALKKESIKLPSNAKNIRKITIEYENRDGSFDEKSVELKKSIDSNIPLYIFQNSINNKHTIKDGKYKELGSIKYLSFYSFEKTLKIKTKDTIKTFLLDNPSQIVIDFKRNSRLENSIIWSPSTVFKRIKVGNHDGYYRTVIELNKKYQYKVIKIFDGFKIVFN